MIKNLKRFCDLCNTTKPQKLSKLRFSKMLARKHGPKIKFHNVPRTPLFEERRLSENCLFIGKKTAFTQASLLKKGRLWYITSLVDFCSKSVVDNYLNLKQTNLHCFSIAFFQHETQCLHILDKYL